MYHLKRLVLIFKRRHGSVFVAVNSVVFFVVLIGNLYNYLIYR